MTPPPHQTFIVSPADCGGPRALRLLERLRAGDETPPSIGEGFSQISALYFRGKLRYAERFARPRRGQTPISVITPTHGLLPADVPIDAALLEAFARGRIDERHPPYRTALDQSLRTLRNGLGAGDRVVFLGSLATRKYAEALGGLGDAVAVPRRFFGLGNMQRGSLLIGRARKGRELEYVRLVDRSAAGSTARPRSFGSETLPSEEG